MTLPNLDEVWRHMRVRPEMWVGARSLDRLRAYFDGYCDAAERYAGDRTDPLFIPQEFHDWVAYRLRFQETTSGYVNMIRERTGNEDEAIDRFFALVDEFRARRPHIVAQLTGIRRLLERTCDGVTESLPFPKAISLVTYTNDPGFFAVSDTEVDWPWRRFYPCIDWFESFAGFKREDLTIVDPNWNYGLSTNESVQGREGSV